VISNFFPGINLREGKKHVLIHNKKSLRPREREQKIPDFLRHLL